MTGLEPGNDSFGRGVGEPMTSTMHQPESTDGVVENVDAARFELWIAGEVLSFASYSSQPDGSVVVPHVETKPQHRGNGNAAFLMDGLLGLLRSSGRRIVPLCPFAADHVRSNQQHHDLLAS